MHHVARTSRRCHRNLLKHALSGCIFVALTSVIDIESLASTLRSFEAVKGPSALSVLVRLLLLPSLQGLRNALSAADNFVDDNQAYPLTLRTSRTFRRPFATIAAAKARYLSAPLPVAKSTCPGHGRSSYTDDRYEVVTKTSTGLLLVPMSASCHYLPLSCAGLSLGHETCCRCEQQSCELHVAVNRLCKCYLPPASESDRSVLYQADLLQKDRLRPVLVSNAMLRYHSRV